MVWAQKAASSDVPCSIDASIMTWRSTTGRPDRVSGIVRAQVHLATRGDTTRAKTSEVTPASA